MRILCQVLLALSIQALLGCLHPVSAPSPVDEPTPGLRQESFSTGGPDVEDVDPAISGDGKSLFFSSNVFGPHYELCVKAVGSRTITRLLESPANERFPRPSPASPRTLAFCSDVSGEWGVYVVHDYLNPGPWPDHRVSARGRHALHPSWSPDGSLLVYCETPDFIEWELVISDPQGTSHHYLGIDGLFPDWSPQADASRIAFQRIKQRDQFLSGLWILELEALRVQKVNVVLDGAQWAATHPTWSPDGRWLAFVTMGKRGEDSRCFEFPEDIAILRADGEQLHELTSDAPPDSQPTWSPTGAIFFSSLRHRNRNVFSLKVNPEVLTTIESAGE